MEKLAQGRKRLTKLYGRDTEIQHLRKELEQVCISDNNRPRTLILIQGDKGQGKRTLAAQLEPSLHASTSPARKAIFVEFDLHKSQAEDPNSGIKTAIKQLCHKLGALPKRHNTDHPGRTLEALQASIKKELTWEVHLLCQVIPELHILDTDISKESLIQQKSNYRLELKASSKEKFSILSRASTENHEETQRALAAVATGKVQSAPDRQQHALKRMINVISSFAPLVFVCNDAQFCDSASLQLFKGGITDTRNPAFLMVWTYPSSLEGPGGRRLKEPIEQIETLQQERSVHIERMTLAEIPQDAIQEFMTDLLAPSSTANIKPLTTIIYKKTLGNIFFVIHYLVSLAQQGHLVFNFTTLEWSWDLEDVRKSLTATNSVADLMKRKLRESPLAQSILPLAACLGATFEVWVLREVMLGIQSLDTEKEAKVLFEKLLGTMTSVSDEQLTQLENEGLIDAADHDNQSYSIIHEQVVDGALEILGEKVNKTKFFLGCILYDRMKLMDPQQKEQILFLVVNLLNFGLEDLPVHRKDAVRQINMEAGDEAYLAAAFKPSASYYGAAVDLLPNNHWDIICSESLYLLTMAAETEMCLGHYERMSDYIGRILVKDMDIMEKIAVYEVKMDALVAQKRVKEAWDQCFIILKLAGVPFHVATARAKSAMAIANLKMAPKHFKPEALSVLPASLDPIHAQISKIHDRQIEMALMVSSFFVILFAIDIPSGRT